MIYTNSNYSAQPLTSISTLSIYTVSVLPKFDEVNWWLWGIAHIYFLIGVRNRIVVAMHWLWIYFKGDRGARLITQVDSQISPKDKNN